MRVKTQHSHSQAKSEKRKKKTKKATDKKSKKKKDQDVVDGGCAYNKPPATAKKSFRSFRFVSFWDLGKHIMISGGKRNETRRRWKKR